MTMFLAIFLAIVALLVVLDTHRYRAFNRRLWIACVVVDTIPLWTLALMIFDNTPTLMRVGMWFTWSWMLLTLPRLASALLARIGLRRVGYVVAMIVALALIWGAAVGRKALRVNEIEICSPDLPAAFDGYRIAHFSDLHLGALVDTEGELSHVVDRINGAAPDLVCFTGDLVNIRHSELDSLSTALLQQIKAPVISVLGNHDVGTYIRRKKRLPAEVSRQRLIEQQTAMGWHLLQNETIYLHRGGDSISLSGISFDPELKRDRHRAVIPLTDDNRTYRGVPDSLYNITLVHLPQLWEQILDRGYGDLTLAGHVHSMQMKFRTGEGRGWSPAAWMYDRWSGRYDERGATLYINDGIGYVGYPLRLGADPELTLITLRQCR